MSEEARQESLKRFKAKRKRLREKASRDSIEDNSTRSMSGTWITSEKSPEAGQAVIESDVGYHIRQGGHSIEKFDWQCFMDFADYHLKKKKK